MFFTFWSVLFVTCNHRFWVTHTDKWLLYRTGSQIYAEIRRFCRRLYGFVRLGDKPQVFYIRRISPIVFVKAQYLAQEMVKKYLVFVWDDAGGTRAAKKVLYRFEGHGLSSSSVETSQNQRMRCSVSSNSTETEEDSATKTKVWCPSLQFYFINHHHHYSSVMPWSKLCCVIIWLQKTPFGYTRKDVLLIGVGVTALGIGLESGLEVHKIKKRILNVFSFSFCVSVWLWWVLLLSNGAVCGSRSVASRERSAADTGARLDFGLDIHLYLQSR